MNKDTVCLKGVYHTQCFDAAGNLRWEVTSENIITDQGKNSLLDAYLGAGSGVTSYMSLITAGTALSSSTYASPTVTETTSSIIANRLAMTWSGASAGSKAATSVSFSIIGTAVITGNMIVSGGSGVTAVGNTSATGGVLFSSSTFGSSKSVTSGDTLNILYSVSV